MHCPSRLLTGAARVSALPMWLLIAAANPLPGFAADSEARCVVLAKARGSLALVNRCRACRAVAIERRAKDGAGRRATYFVAPISMAPVPLRGAVKLTIVEERPCRRTSGATQPSPALPAAAQPVSTVPGSVRLTSDRGSGARPST